ncbi:MAG: hypothetical protein RSE41_09050, partial [Clostridia bacterium]
NTWATVTPGNIGAAAASHGNHVPTTGTANNAIFLRNDNTWATVTPGNIGAAAASHTHSYDNYSKWSLVSGTVTYAVTTGKTVTVKGAGATTVGLDASGNLTISSTDTNTNTWRGVVDNLTSSLTDQSLSANQGRILKAAVDGKAASSHTHNYLSTTNGGTVSGNVRANSFTIGTDSVTAGYYASFLGKTGYSYITLGYAESNYNAVGIGFGYTSAGNNTNCWQIALYGGFGKLKGFGNGDLTWENNKVITAKNCSATIKYAAHIFSGGGTSFSYTTTLNTSSKRTATGKYVITHNLGHTSYVVNAVALTTGCWPNITINNKSANTVELFIMDVNNGLRDCAFDITISSLS